MRLELRGDLVARGRVEVAGDYVACRSHVLVKIFRNGEVVAKRVTRASGRFRIELPDERGRYFARVAESQPDDGNVCTRARSRVRKV